MRAWRLGVGLLAFAVGGVAYAQTWTEHLAFQSGASSCAAFSTIAYTFALNGASLTVSNENGKMFSTTVPESGEFNQTFRSSSGASLAMSGNVKTKAFTLSNAAMGCTWKTKR